jgi:hypothetical protein
MTELNLTQICAAATNDKNLGRGRAVKRFWAKAGMLMMGAVMVPGCINIAAPEEPIVIQLDINIRAEVLYRLAEDASNTIDENADIF